MTTPGFVLLGDAIWIDFVNTARGTGIVYDRLVDLAAYQHWVSLEKLQQDQASTPFEEIVEFRDRLTALAVTISAERQAPAVSIHAINSVLAKTTGYHQLTRVQGSWRTVFTQVRPATALDAIARSAAMTLSDPAAVVRECSGEDCTLFFVDTSPSHSRRWCSTSTCSRKLRVDRRRTTR
jgi:predicted RNA-binding Zn ribbon-like protein